MVLDLRSRGRLFNCRTTQCRLATLGKSFTRVTNVSKVMHVPLWKFDYINFNFNLAVGSSGFELFPLKHGLTVLSGYN